jgi:hypothetical protein
MFDKDTSQREEQMKNLEIIKIIMSKITIQTLEEKNLAKIYENKEMLDKHFDELVESVKAPTTLEEGIQMMYEADKFIREYPNLISQTKLTDAAKAREMFYILADIEVMSEQYEIKVKEMIFAALARGEEVYIPVFRFDGQISNFGNVRKMSDKSAVEKYLIDGVEVFSLDLVYGKDGGEVDAFEVKGLFDSILCPIAKGWAVEGEEDYEYLQCNKTTKI